MAWAWLCDQELLDDHNSKELSLQNGLFTQFWALSKCQFGDTVDEATSAPFCAVCCPGRTSLWPSRQILGGSGTQSTTTIWTSPNVVPIWAKPPHLHPEEEAWLDVHLDKLVAKGVIGPILPGEQPRCVTPLLLVPGI